MGKTSIDYDDARLRRIHRLAKLSKDSTINLHLSRLSFRINRFAPLKSSSLFYFPFLSFKMCRP